MNQFISKSFILFASLVLLCGLWMAASVSLADEQQTSSTTTSSSDINVNNLLQGEWIVEMTTVDQDSSSGDADELFPQLGVYNFSHTPLQEGVLFGTYLPKGSEDDASEFDVKLLVQSDAEHSGSFKMIKRKKEEEPSEDVEEVAELRSDDTIVFDIPYNFVTHKPNSPNQPPVVYASSQGRFTANNGVLKGTYQFLFTNKENFILSLVYDATTGQDGVTKYKIDRIVGTKQVNKELSFFQKYGSTIMIMVFFIGSRFLTRNMQAGQAPGQAPPAGGNQ
ncbi:hypothetical protein FDP41_002233 [Naegleria fowleri]|uniref:Uncharacterized protein n=1 Tax=Naegleria fowleri TaxID=5763 RepID=A0A6A5BK95_NAEFO|nr:uncharacterized protein FDP41_002233 [Naegleria fowleri]KAF0978413.1 hypothetical protein FDP41_002233 [Naegleria fowleri]CAG4714731.1 unnamed protein product [Naegleria fowleri]